MFTGIDIGGTKCAVIVGDENGIVEKIRFATTDVNDTINNIIAAVEKLGANQAIGISCGGPLDSKRGVIMSPPNLPGWDNIEIVKMLEEKFNVPVGIANDANACAMAEWKFGAGRGCDNMVFMTFGTGLGAGLILDGKLYSGTNDMAGEVGHVRLSDFGPVGYGKAGSFEGFCSGAGIAELGRTYAKEQLAMGKTTSYCKSYAELETVNAKTVADAADAGDEIAIKVYDTCAYKLGVGVSILIDILNPERIVIGSIFTRSENLLREKMEEVIKKEALSHAAAVCKVVPAELGESIGDYAALAVAQETYRLKNS